MKDFFNKNKTLSIVIGVIVGLLLLCCLCGLISSLTGSSNFGTTPNLIEPEEDYEFDE